MAQTVLVTGSTGSVGSNVCRLGARQGREVRALVRPGTQTAPLKACGAEPVIGDVTDPFASQTVTEDSRVVPLSPADSPYVRAKRAAYDEGMARVSRGTEIAFVVPAGIYGPSLFLERALVPTIFTGTLMKAAAGELTRYLPMPISWVLAEDVADIALRALDRGRSGARYLAMGRAEDARSIPAFCNTFLELAGIDRRVAEVHPGGGAVGDDPEFGPMVRMVSPNYPSLPGQAQIHQPSRLPLRSV